MSITTAARKIAAGAVLGLAATAVLGAGAAQADDRPTLPYKCTTGNADSASGWASCVGGLGQFRAMVNCETPGTLRAAYGPWQLSLAAPTYSTAVCGAGEVASPARFERINFPIDGGPGGQP